MFLFIAVERNMETHYEDTSDSYHFFFDCSHYANTRYKLFHNLSWLPNDCAIDLKLLTSGNPILSNEQNEIIFKHVFEYIKRSERFLV